MRHQGDPCSPEKLIEMEYEGDEFLVRETTVSWFVWTRCIKSPHGSRDRAGELPDNKSWFVFEVELDGETKISHIILNIKTFGLKYSARLLRLPTRFSISDSRRFRLDSIQHDFSARSCWYFRNVLLHMIRLVTTPSDETQGGKLKGRSTRLQFARRNLKKMRWLAHNATLRKEFEKNKVANIRLRAVPVSKMS